VTLTERVHLKHPTHDDRQRAVAGLIQRIGLTDLLVIIWAVMGAQLIRFGRSAAQATLSAEQGASFELGYTLFSVVLIGVWVLMLNVHGSHDHRLLGHGPEEYKAVATASFWLFGGLAVVSYVLRLDVARGYVAMALPAGMIGLLVSRWLWRKWLTLHRAQGLLSASVLVVGDQEHLTSLIRSLNSVPEAGYRVVAACCGDADQSSFGPIPILGSESEAAEVAQRIGVSTVACTSSSRFGTSGLRRLSWALEGQDVDLVVVPGLTDVAGPRVLTRPVAGLSLLHIEAPVITGPKLAIKTAMDRVGAVGLLLILSPLFVVVSFLVWRHDRAPVFYRQERIGKNGRVFGIFKFRTMVPDAEASLLSLLARSGQEAAPLYKLRSDPRLTPIGTWLRRYSIDELPQLINVLRGEMSLIGPRPQVEFEVAKYANDVRRRLLVKPGMTGLWQINGRSDLTWEESVRFDLYYVENWSVMSDLIILWHTGRAVLRGVGAY
jgi:exopolysaccharide biosynthesis polyprenyl glycosylphosphotransferase